MNRRSFLGHSAKAVAGAAFAPLASVAEPAPHEPLWAIDTHIHLYDPTRAQGVPWPPKNDALLYKPYLSADFGALAHASQVASAIVIEASPWLEDNQWVLDLVAHDPLIAAFIGHLNPGEPDFAAHLRRFSANPLFRGIRLEARALAQGLGRQNWEDDLRRVADANLTVDLLGSGAMLPDVIKLAGLAPNLRLVIDHLPFPEWDSDIETAKKALIGFAEMPNVYAKVSAVVRAKDGKPIEDAGAYKPRLDLLGEIFGADRVLYGSNWPVSNHLAPYATVHKIVADYYNAKGREVADKFFVTNSAAAYRWPGRL
jgi:predicted TIM-barrel fold metal-dependent hydrolase